MAAVQARARALAVACALLAAACGEQATLESIEVLPNTATIPVGTIEPFVSVGHYDDDSRRDLTDVADWSSSDEAIATIALNDFNIAIATGLAPGEVILTATEPESEQSFGAGLTVVPVALTTLTVGPERATIPVGTIQPFVARGFFNDGTDHGITGSLEWSSSDEAVATVELSGPDIAIATGVAPGEAVITASDPETGHSFGALLTVVPVTLVTMTVEPGITAVVVGDVQPYVATGFYNDGSEFGISDSVNWDSSDEGVATIALGPGGNAVASTVAPGETTVTATDPATGLFASALLTVAAPSVIDVRAVPGGASILRGENAFLKLFRDYNDGSSEDITDLAAWSSADENIATVLLDGFGNAEVVGVAAGVVQITGFDAATGRSGIAVITVSLPTVTDVRVVPNAATLSVAGNAFFKAFRDYNDGSSDDITDEAIWSSDADAVATVQLDGFGNAEVTGVAVGDVWIRASDPVSGRTGILVIAVR